MNCSECGKRMKAPRPNQMVCDDPKCKRARRTDLQRDRRAVKRGYMLTHIRTPLAASQKSARA
jgi:hypothetical protein